MSWREKSARRAQRSEWEERDLPHRMRTGYLRHPWLILGQYVLGFGGLAVIGVYQSWQTGDGVTLRVLLLMLAFAAIFAIRLARRPKVRNAKLRKLNRD